MGKPKETQKTPKGHKIPVATTSEFIGNLEKAAEPKGL